MDVRVSIQPNPTQPGSYRATLHTGRAAEFEAFLRHVEAASTITQADALAVLTAAARWVEARAEEGREVDLGPMGRSRLGMKGRFERPPERVMDGDVTLTLNWQLPRKMKARVAKAGDRLTRKHVAPLPKLPNLLEARLMLGPSERHPAPDVYQPGRVMRVIGSRLDYDPTRDDEGAYLVDPAGAERRVEIVATLEPKTLVFIMPADATGPQRLLIRRRHPKGHGTLMTGWLHKTLEPLVE